MATELRITGLVQGIGYRAAFAQQARALRLSGWVRNRRDGSVEASIAGDPQALRQLIGWAEHGPIGARVQCVAAIEVGDPLVADGAFQILPTA